MIEKMKKVSVFIKQNGLDESLQELRSLGLVHIMTPAGHSEAADELQNRTAAAEKAMHIIDAHVQQDEKRKNGGTENRKQPGAADQSIYEDADQLAERIMDLQEEMQQNEEEIKGLKRDRDFFSNTASFDPHDIEYLAEKGIAVDFYQLRPDALKDIENSISYTIVNRTKNLLLIMTWNDMPDPLEGFESLKYPKLSPAEIDERTAELMRRNEDIDAEIIQLSDQKQLLLNAYRSAMQDLQFERVRSGMQQEQPVRWLTGFIPEEELKQLQKAAENNAWGLIIDDPAADEPVPTKLKMNRFTSLIQPIFDILGTVPGYREYDISFLFLSFFAVFVAMIIGDAGYGVLFLAGTVFLHVKTKEITKTTGLLYLLSICTVIWGAVTGTWFGSAAIAAMPPFSYLAVREIASFPEVLGGSAEVSQTTVIYICFIIGTLQLSIACLMNFQRDFPSLKAYSHLGWLSLIIGLYFLVLNLVLEFPLVSWSVYAIAGGIALIVIFGEQETGQSFSKGLVRGIGGLFTTFLDSISTFSNIISYIRLFAVGMASVAIASSFNDMASSLMGGIAVPAALLILLIGHGLNIVMGLLSVFVHGIRLNMLEFSGQLGMEWTGFSYNPFRKEEYND